MSEVKKKSKVGKVILTIAIIILGIILVTIAGFWIFMRIGTNGYYLNSKSEFVMPGIDDSIIPQGLDYDERSNSFFVCGYSDKDKPSKIYIVNADTKVKKSIELLDEDNDDFTGHSGGLVVHGDYIYLAGSSSGCLYVFSYEEAIKCENNGQLRCLGKYSLKSENDKIRVSFVGEIEGKLVVGEYYKIQGSSYKTPENHHAMTVDGDMGGACVAINYSNDANSSFGLEKTPCKAYILPELAQGITEYNGHIYVSCSSGLSKSIIYNYDISKTKESGNLHILDLDLPLFILDSSCLEKQTLIPPMSEEIVIKDGRMYVTCESASSKYLFGLIIGAYNMFSTDIGYFGK